MRKTYQVGVGIAFLLLCTGFGLYTVHTHMAQSSSVWSLRDGDIDQGEEAAEDPRVYSAAAAATASTPKVSYQVSSSTPQFVLLSFDGSKSVDMLNDTLAFETKMASEGKPLHFTYFINAAYFLTKSTANLYQGPGHSRGVSAIGFSDSTHDIAARVRAFNTAYAAGNEIGSHSAGHFNGAQWSFDEWKQEFDSFASLMANVQQNNASQKIDAPIFLDSIRGFRAPELGVNANLYKVLQDEHFTYDGSGVGAMYRWPKQDTNGIWHIPLGTIFVGPNKSPSISMDYSLWMLQSGAKNVATKGTPLWNTYFNEVESAYMDYFNTNYHGTRAPVVIGHHFSLWNDGVYWEAMKAFAEQVCGQPHVQCVTFSTLVDYLNTTGAPTMVSQYPTTSR